MSEPVGRAAVLAYVTDAAYGRRAARALAVVGEGGTLRVRKSVSEFCGVTSAEGFGGGAVCGGAGIFLK